MHPYRSYPSYSQSHSPVAPITSSLPSARAQAPSPHKQHPPYGFPTPSVTMNVNMSHHLTPVGHNQAPQHTHHHHGQSSRRASSSSNRHHHNDYSDSESDGEDGKVEKDKLEIRREKNRVKQRNLRLRRANHIADLEKNLANIRADHSALQHNVAHLQARENNLQGWVHDLESALFRNGLAGEVETLRRIWADRDTAIPQKQHQIRPSSQHGFPNHAHPLPTPGGVPVDPLSTLARAAASSIPTGPPSAGYSEGRMSFPPSASGSRPTLPRPSSFSRPFENPYPTPELQWGAQMNEWVPGPADFDKKRKRESQSDYHPARPGLHPMSGRLSESNVHTLPPIQSHQPGSPTSARPTSAPYQSRTPVPHSASTPGTANVSPRSIRISDLVSPRPSHIDHTLPSLSTSLSGSELIHPSMPESQRQLERLTTREGGWTRSSKGDLSPEREIPSLGGMNMHSKKLPPLKFFQPKEERAYPVSTPTSPRTLSPNGSLFKKEREDVSPKTRISLSPTALDPQISMNTQYGISPHTEGSQWASEQMEMEMGMTDPTPHPSVYTARILLRSVLPQPITLHDPPILPDLFKEQQQIILTALSNLYPPEVSDKFRFAQMKGLAPEDAKCLLEYQSSLSVDSRLVLFPIAILRAAVIRIIKSKKEGFYLTAFNNSALKEARVFGNPLDPDAWEMPDTFWDQWGGWFPLGREYCASISAWRRRDGHVGSGVVEMILGLKGESVRRREDWVGKPPGWKMSDLVK
ncbi:uncharacterized protein I303_102363 [Kwoniella dejecticola CBS 10117]|uniref:BZIP domain-containing protein n=1 Tax=Kwoniella dejecticola CBS 10117 TaxID=1296121 RepID=A0A1A6AB67_9TREE|nr:uncharacterized protein I303_01497 [Kwoniella dejecticola CBS 10117]OBR87295.1 hypothetical protein I303_01497 [Kwoniella dejecticola CBS 10117]